MLVAKLEIWPRGDVASAYEVSRVFIANLGRDEEQVKGDPWTAVYKYAAWIGNPGAEENMVPLPTSGTAVATFSHDRQDGPEICVERALKALRTQHKIASYDV
jgi:hypothetical protein